MLPFSRVDHIGIRVHDGKRAEAFYALFGFQTIWSGDFQNFEPIIMRHEFSGVVINLLGPANQPQERNVLQDKSEVRYAGITHFALTVSSIKETKQFLNKHRISITEQLTFGTTKALFIRDPDGNTIEFDEHGTH